VDEPLHWINSYPNPPEMDPESTSSVNVSSTSQATSLGPSVALTPIPETGSPASNAAKLVYLPASHGDPTPGIAQGNLWHVPICSEGSAHLRHSCVYIMSNQCEDDRRVFKSLQLAYSQCKRRVRHRFFHRLDRIHRAQVSEFLVDKADLIS
jgi:hypothetical protein